MPRLLLFVALVLLATAAPASATTVARSDPGGAQLANGSTIAASSESTFTVGFSSPNMRCHASIDATLATGSSATSIAGTLNSFTLSSCFDVAFGFTIDHCSAVSPFATVTATASASGGTIALSNLWLRCHIQNSGTPGFACYISAPSAIGAFTNLTSTLRYSNVTALRTAPAGATDDLGSTCTQISGAFSVSFGHLHTTGGTTVTLTTS
jgi:hypothetical protein